ncbi:MAG: VPLPA-CTERM sorting domain-containing protein [Gammaproteobacteria bacterium]|nr:VPLPA-CTERM sorting domain-containing protein [Gammaproteobacteria bacterium]
MIQKLILLLCLSFCAMSSHAALITYEFSGAFDRAVDPSSDVAFGDLFQATFSYDDAAPLASIVEPGTRAQYNTGAISIISGANSYTAMDTPQLQILDDWVGSNGTARDNFFISVEMADTSGTGYYLLQIDMIDSTATSLNSLAIPDVTTVEEMAADGRLFLRRFSSRNVEEWAASGRFSSITPVPVPAAVWLFASGLIGLASLARRKIS